MDLRAELNGAPEQVLPGCETESSLEALISQISFPFVQPELPSDAAEWGDSVSKEGRLSVVQPNRRAVI
jgi:hypothetical protein